ncbi:MAG: helix-turn-helix domain-containing protein [Clostridiales bacterium]|nr:helix-turn-helix domain-containing protein [Clostridiales bacterium]
MDRYVTGAMIRELREKKQLTQAELAEKLYVSDKTVSKWENAKGYPDITLLEPIAKVFGISVAELVCGRAVSNINVSANMMRSKFYVCPVCGNAIHSMGEAVINCHGVLLTPAQAEDTDEEHQIFIEGVEDEYYVRIEHDMTKRHYISFVAALSPDRIQMVKLYPEGNAEARFKMNGVKQIFFYCNKDGLFSINVHKAIDGKPTAYDDAAERRALEQAAKAVLG